MSTFVSFYHAFVILPVLGRYKTSYKAGLFHEHIVEAVINRPEYSCIGEYLDYQEAQVTASENLINNLQNEGSIVNTGCVNDYYRDPFNLIYFTAPHH